MKRHFHTFDALRFLAFFKVFLLYLPILAFPTFNIFRKGGGIGVVFFFVLSGFLITYIILEEKVETGRLNLYHFFIRRILRIWPLYFVMVGFAFATPFLLSWFKLSYSNEGYEPNWLMTLTFLENYKIIVTHSHPNVSPLPVMWSLCIEEHFYFIWGIALYFISLKRIPIIIISSIILSTFANWFFVRNNILTSEILTNLSYFAFGAIPAYLLVNKRLYFETFINRIPSLYKTALVIITLAYVLISPNINYSLREYIEPTILGVLFCLIICCTIPDNNIKIGNGNILSRLGLYTYGLYLYHVIVINLFIQIFKKVGWSLDKSYYAITFIGITLGITVFISQLSYHLFEKHFLRLKTYFY
jgi:Predicted acyltransferases